jgi:hypothetical protein
MLILVLLVYDELVVMILGRISPLNLTLPANIFLLEAFEITICNPVVMMQMFLHVILILNINYAHMRIIPGQEILQNH